MIYFIDVEHQDAYIEFMIKDKINNGDLYRKTLFYILSSCDKLRMNINKHYDFKEHSILLESIEKCGYYCSSEKLMLELAYNFFNGFGDKTLYDYLGTFDIDNTNVLLSAIKIYKNAV